MDRRRQNDILAIGLDLYAGCQVYVGLVAVGKEVVRTAAAGLRFPYTVDGLVIVNGGG